MWIVPRFLPPELIQVWTTRKEAQEKMPKRFRLLYGFGSGPPKASLGFRALSLVGLTSKLRVPDGWRKGKSAAAELGASWSLCSPDLLALIQRQELETPFSAPGTQGYPPVYALGT